MITNSTNGPQTGKPNEPVFQWAARADEAVTPQVPPVQINKSFSILLRITDSSTNWTGPLWQMSGRGADPACRLYGGTERNQPALICELRTDYRPEPLRLVIMRTLLAQTPTHDILLRYSGPNVQLFLDGVLVDEDWPAGNLLGDATRQCVLGTDGTTPLSGKIVAASLWSRALSDEEIITISGGRDAVAAREPDILGTESTLRQYWVPRGYRTGVGDCMPFFADERFHLFYLADRHQHQSKWGKGAHQWAHISTTDLQHWEQHPMAVPITEEWEGSICTGSVFQWDQRYYAFYAVRTLDGSPAPLQTAVSADGIHFEKTPAQVKLGNPYRPDSARDPVVFHDPATGLFHMLVTTSLRTAPLASHHSGCLAHLTSTDLQHWEQREPFIVPGLASEPECSDYFYWHGWYYLIFSNNGVARYRMSRNPLGPWQHPKVDTFDGNYYRVMKTAAFTGNRRLGAAFVERNGYGGYLVFREIIQHKDGTLGTKFPVELIPPTDAALSLSLTPVTGKVTQNAKSYSISSDTGMGAAFLSDIPRNVRITMRVTPKPGVAAFGLCVRADRDYASGQELRFEPEREKVGWRHPLAGSTDEVSQDALYQVEGLSSPFMLDLILKDDLFDLCIGGRRTLIDRRNSLQGKKLFLFVQDGTVEFSDISIRPLHE